MTATHRLTLTTRMTLTTLSSWFVILLCAFVFIGWQYDIPIMRSMVPGAPQTVPLTALLLSALAFALLSCKRRWHGAVERFDAQISPALWPEDSTGPAAAGATWQWICWVLSGATVLLSLWFLGQYAFGFGSGLEHLFYPQRVAQQSVTLPGRPSPHTALVAMLLGLSTALYAAAHPTRRRWGMRTALVGFSITWVILIGYATNIVPFYALQTDPEVGMSPLTMVGFFGVVLGILGLRPDEGVMALLHASTSGGQVLRTLLPVAALLPLLFGWAINYGVLAGWLGAGMSFGLTWGVTSLLFAGFLVWQALSLHRRDLQNLQVAAERERMLAELAAASEQIQQANVALQDQAAALERSNQDLLQFAHVASRDLQAPLRSVNGFVQQLRTTSGGQLDAQAEAWIDRIGYATDRLQGLVHDLLIYSQVNAAEYQALPVVMEEVQQEVTIMLDHELQASGAQIYWNTPTIVPGEHTQLVQLMLNLCLNAIRYRSQKSLRIHIDVQEDDDCFTFGVEDNGIGIDPAYGARIFELFSRPKNEAHSDDVGVGLAVCRRIVNRHGGQIWFESTPGVGSTFFFTLPRQRSPRRYR